MTTQMMSSQLELHRLHTGRQVPVVAASRMLKQYLFRYQVDNNFGGELDKLIFLIFYPNFSTSF